MVLPFAATIIEAWVICAESARAGFSAPLEVRLEPTYYTQVPPAFAGGLMKKSLSISEDMCQARASYIG